MVFPCGSLLWCEEWYNKRGSCIPLRYTHRHVNGYLAVKCWFLGIHHHGCAAALSPWQDTGTFRAIGLLWSIVRRKRGSPTKSNPTNRTNCVCKLELRVLGIRFRFAKSAVKYCHQSQIWHWQRFEAARTMWAQPPDGLHCFTNYFAISEFS